MARPFILFLILGDPPARPYHLTFRLLHDLICSNSVFFAEKNTCAVIA